MPLRSRMDDGERERLRVSIVNQHLPERKVAKEQSPEHEQQQGNGADAAVKETATWFFDGRLFVHKSVVDVGRASGRPLRRDMRGLIGEGSGIFGGVAGLATTRGAEDGVFAPS